MIWATTFRNLVKSDVETAAALAWDDFARFMTEPVEMFKVQNKRYLPVWSRLASSPPNEPTATSKTLVAWSLTTMTAPTLSQRFWSGQTGPSQHIRLGPTVQANTGSESPCPSPDRYDHLSSNRSGSGQSSRPVELSTRAAKILVELGSDQAMTCRTLSRLATTGRW